MATRKQVWEALQIVRQVEDTLLNKYIDYNILVEMETIFNTYDDIDYLKYDNYDKTYRVFSKSGRIITGEFIYIPCSDVNDKLISTITGTELQL